MPLTSAKRARGRPRGERSPFSSPYTALLSTPVAARRGSLEERRRPAANFNVDASPAPEIKIDEEEDEDEPEEGVEDQELDEDGEGEASPLLPIFSAAHLGIRYLFLSICWACAHVSLAYIRFPSCLSPNAYHPFTCCPTMRNYTFLGPTEVASGLSVSCEAYPATDSNVPFLASHTIRPNG